MAENFDINWIQGVLPHRYPFLFVDKIIEMDPPQRIVGIKNVSINEWFFCGHFPEEPIMPGVLMVEAMAQIGGILILSNKENKGKRIYFMGIDKVRFRRPVVPGDQIRFEVSAMKIKSRTGKMIGMAYVNDKLVVEGELMFILTTKEIT